MQISPITIDDHAATTHRHDRGNPSWMVLKPEFVRAVNISLAHCHRPHYLIMNSRPC